MIIFLYLLKNEIFIIFFNLSLTCVTFMNCVMLLSHSTQLLQGMKVSLIVGPRVERKKMRDWAKETASLQASMNYLLITFSSFT